MFSLNSPDGAVLYFPGGADDSLGLRDCCWGFPGEVNVTEARFQGESSPDAGVDSEGDHECPLESGVLPALFQDHPDIASEGLHGCLSWVALLGLPRSLLRALFSGFGVGVHFFLRKWPQRPV